MEDHLRLYAAYLWELSTATILPFEYSTVADEFYKRLVELSRLSHAKDIGLGELVKRADVFRDVTAQLDLLANTWRERYAKDEQRDSAPAHALNQAFKRLSRVLIPLQSTVRGRYGHDPYGFTPQSTMIPCLFELASLESPELGSEQRSMLETQLVRERNRVADGLTDACAIAADALAALH
jgi:hypothetical protein